MTIITIIAIAIIVTIVCSRVSYKLGKAQPEGAYYDFLQERTRIVRLNGHDYLFVNLVGYDLSIEEAANYAKVLEEKGISAVLFGGGPPIMAVGDTPKPATAP